MWFLWGGTWSWSWCRSEIDYYRCPSASSFSMLQGERVEQTDLPFELGELRHHLYVVGVCQKISLQILNLLWKLVKTAGKLMTKFLTLWWMRSCGRNGSYLADLTCQKSRIQTDSPDVVEDWIQDSTASASINREDLKCRRPIFSRIAFYFFCSGRLKCRSSSSSDGGRRGRGWRRWRWHTHRISHCLVTSAFVSLLRLRDKVLQWGRIIGFLLLSGQSVWSLIRSG